MPALLTRTSRSPASSTSRFACSGSPTSALNRRAADLAQLLRLVGPGAVAEDDLGARRSELGRDRSADAAGRPGDERLPSSEAKPSAALFNSKRPDSVSEALSSAARLFETVFTLVDPLD